MAGNEWGYGQWGDGVWGDFSSGAPARGFLGGTLTLEPALTGTMQLSPALTGVFTASRGGGSDNMEYSFESNTVRLWLTNLAHDLSGDPAGAATVTYTVTRANGDSLTSGSMTYYAGRGWHASFTAPSLADGVTESLRVVVRAVYGGATVDFRAYVPVKDIAAA